ncbi:hypothetical protein M0805_000536 [Coniferiporia weirii]|nr:hypothetical protein M0805_000536 [Coniferiporia weirii]
MSVDDVLPSRDNTFGCLFLAGMLWGSGNVQLYFYYDKYSKTDKWGFRLYIFVLYVADTLHQAFLLNALYVYFVTDFVHVDRLGRLEKPLNDVTILTAFVDVLAHYLYVMRVWHLSKRNAILTGVLVLFVLGQFATTIVYFGQIYNLSEISQLTTVIKTERIMNCIVAITDISIASVIVFLLRSHRSGIKQTETLISRLVLYTISSGLVTSVAALGALITATTLPHTFVYLIFDLITAKLYFNSVMALLNSRRAHDEIYDSEIGISLSNIRPRYPNGGSTTQNSSAAVNAKVIDIKIDLERTVGDNTDERKACCASRSIV